MCAQAIPDCLSTEAAKGMVPEIGSGVLVFQILISADTTHFGLALVSRAREEVVKATTFIVDRDFRTEKGIYG
jgi:hypothetical protein